jgi:hypothetical protein
VELNDFRRLVGLGVLGGMIYIKSRGNLTASTSDCHKSTFGQSRTVFKYFPIRWEPLTNCDNF